MSVKRQTEAGSEPMNQSSRFLAATMSVVVVVALGALTLDWLLRSDTLPVKSVSFAGPFQQVSRTRLEKVLLPHINGNFLMLDLVAAQKAVEGLPWIHRATVQRRWPSGIHIQFDEQTLVARWGESAWLNEEGDVVELHGTVPDTEALPRLSGPQGYGPTVLNQYRQLGKPLSGLGLQITGLSYTSRRSWHIDLGKGLQIVMGREDDEKAMQRFVQVYPKLLAPRINQIQRVDLRYTNGFAVQWLNRHALSNPQPDEDSKRS